MMVYWIQTRGRAGRGAQWVGLGRTWLPALLPLPALAGVPPPAYAANAAADVDAAIDAPGVRGESSPAGMRSPVPAPAAVAAAAAVAVAVGSGDFEGDEDDGRWARAGAGPAVGVGAKATVARAGVRPPLPGAGTPPTLLPPPRSWESGSAVTWVRERAQGERGRGGVGLGIEPAPRHR